jgi:hypothetical protein
VALGVVVAGVTAYGLFVGVLVSPGVGNVAAGGAPLPPSGRDGGEATVVLLAAVMVSLCTVDGALVLVLLVVVSMAVDASVEAFRLAEDAK